MIGEAVALYGSVALCFGMATLLVILQFHTLRTIGNTKQSWHVVGAACDAAANLASLAHDGKITKEDSKAVLDKMTDKTGLGLLIFDGEGTCKYDSFSDLNPETARAFRNTVLDKATFSLRKGGHNSGRLTAPVPPRTVPQDMAVRNVGERKGMVVATHHAG